MKLMDRSLADVLELVDEGVVLGESVVGRVAADVSVSVFILVFGVAMSMEGWLTGMMCRS